MTVEEMMQAVRDLLLGSGLGAVALLSLIEIAPIKVNPWRFIARALGRAVNGEMMDKLDSLEKRFERHVREVEEDKADSWRARIIAFNEELIEGKEHTEEAFDNILPVIDKYDRYCEEHPEYPNNKAVFAKANILRVYQDRLKKRDFLDKKGECSHV